MFSFKPTKSTPGCLPCCPSDRPIGPPEERSQTPVRSNHRSAFKWLIQMALSTITQANFSAESIILPVFPLLQGSGDFRQSPARARAPCLPPAARPALPPMCPGSHEEERRALALIRPVRLGRYLLLGRTPFLDMGDSEAEPNEHVDVGRQRPMLLDDTLGEPIRRARAFIQVALDRPNLAACSIERPVRLGRRGENRMFHREDQVTFLDERAVNLQHQPAQVLHIVKGERAVDHVERLRG